MKQSISYCGIVCSDCPIHLAKLETDTEEKEKIRSGIAVKCNELYNTRWNASDINDCDGCPVAGGSLFSGCANCKIRPCAIQKGVKNCAYCKEYPCNILRDFFVNDPKARERLDTVRENLTPGPPPEDC
jgi:hypothetical protein